MSFWKEKLHVASVVLRHPEAWRLPPKVVSAMWKSLSTIRPATSGTGTILYVNTPPVESLAFRRYLRGLTRLAKGESVPLTVHIAVTDRCGYRCARCSNQFMRGKGSHDPSTERIVGLLKELKDAGTVSVAFTGGEPTLRGDLCRLVEACGPEIAPLLFTAGQGVEPATARSLRAAGLVMAVVSLDSHAETVHDALRGEVGAFQQAVRAVRCFLDAGLYTAIQAVADPALLSDPGGLEGWIQLSKGLGVHEAILLDPMALASDGALTDVQRRQLSQLHRLSARSPRMPKVTTAAYLESEDYLGCLAGHSFFYVNSAGDLFPCDFVPLSFGNVFEHGFAEPARRARSVITHSCTQCLWPQLAARSLPKERFPLSWEDSQAIFPRVTGGEPANMMRQMTR